MADEDRTFNAARPQPSGKSQREPNAEVEAVGNAPAFEGISDNPEEDWGEPAEPGTAYSVNHTRRGQKTDAERGPGRKTRAATKDTISRRT
ncbi:hypothetical protein [Phenylobacterium sp.]|jgi:hypothetical protein|uniref:hypothetical protein n=1 Tax=Phenylobacterium sp. TaxID=1871053 RepID=UPI002E31DAAD|nr:hypothetical protein [Phenylobacterium sp.]HEX4712775.1 hypothetical protein [Phenylobacterium sp.]